MYHGIYDVPFELSESKQILHNMKQHKNKQYDYINSWLEHSQNIISIDIVLF